MGLYKDFTIIVLLLIISALGFILMYVAEERNFMNEDLIPEGDYEVTIVEGIAKVSSNEKPYIQIVGAVEGGESITMDIYLSPKALKMGRAKLSKLGWNHSLKEPEFSERKVTLTCYHDEWDGETRAKWELPSFMRKEDGGMTEAQMDELESQMQGDDDNPENTPF